MTKNNKCKIIFIKLFIIFFFVACTMPGEKIRIIEIEKEVEISPVIEPEHQTENQQTPSDQIESEPEEEKVKEPENQEPASSEPKEEEPGVEVQPEPEPENENHEESEPEPVIIPDPMQEMPEPPKLSKSLSAAI